MMKKQNLIISIIVLVVSFANSYTGTAQETERKTIHLADIRLRDGNMLANPSDQYFYFVTSMVSRDNDPKIGPAISAFRGRNLIDWEGPFVVYTASKDAWQGLDVTEIWSPILVQRLLGHADLQMATKYVQDVSKQTDQVVENSRKYVIQVKT